MIISGKTLKKNDNSMTTPFNKIVNKKLLACTLNDVNIKEIKT